METATPFDFKNENNLICEALVKFQLPLIFALSQEIRKIIYTDAPMKENIQRKKKRKHTTHKHRLIKNVHFNFFSPP